ncbi:MAG: hypothetical protein ACTSWL_01060, partial [Promethearchaeota archaeon]
RVDSIIKSALDWDVNCGIGRRAWARNPNAIETAETWNKNHNGHITIPFIPKENFVEELVHKKLQE